MFFLRTEMIMANMVTIKRKVNLTISTANLITNRPINLHKKEIMAKAVLRMMNNTNCQGFFL